MQEKDGYWLRRKYPSVALERQAAGFFEGHNHKTYGEDSIV